MDTTLLCPKGPIIGQNSLNNVRRKRSEPFSIRPTYPHTRVSGVLLVSFVLLSLCYCSGIRVVMAEEPLSGLCLRCVSYGLLYIGTAWGTSWNLR